MDTSMVFERTALGNERFRGGASALSNEQRTALILVNSERSAQDIVKTLSAIGNGYGLLSQLVDLGLIAPKGRANVVTMPARAPAPAAIDPIVRAFVSRTISEMMGAMGDKLCLKIERATTDDELVQATETARMVIMEYAGEAKASAFEAQVQALRAGGISKVA